MDIGTLLALGIMIGFTLKVYLHLKIDFFTFIAALIVTFLTLYLYICVLSHLPFQPQSALGGFLTCLAIFALYQYLILEGIAWIARVCYEHISSSKSTACQNIKKWFQERPQQDCSKSHASDLPICELLQNFTYLHLVGIYVISQVSSLHPINLIGKLESEELLAVIRAWFLFDTFVNNQRRLLKETNQPH